MRSTYGKQLGHGYAILEITEESYILDYESLSLDCPNPDEAESDLGKWAFSVRGGVFKAWAESLKVAAYGWS